MKQVLIPILLLASLSYRVAHADTSREFVRIACVPEAGLLDIEYRYLHDSVADEPGANHARNALLAKAGFHAPGGLALSCVLGGVTYRITAERAPTSQYLCGASPEIYLSLRRGGDKVLSEVVFGESCRQFPSVTRVTIGDGPQSWRGRETELCYATGKDDAPAACEWTSGGPADFAKRFPIDQDRLKRIVSGQERRQSR